MRDLTEKEIAVIDRLAEAWNAYLELPPLGAYSQFAQERKANRNREFMAIIHDAQNRVLSRPAIEQLWSGDR